MRVRVERIRRGRRKPEVDYLETRVPRRRQDSREDGHGPPDTDPWKMSEGEGSGLRLPWQIGRGQKRSG